MGRNRRLSRLRLLAVIAIAVGFVPAVPATAHHAPPPESHDPGGSGGLEGRELVEEQTGFPCFRVTRHLFGLRGAGTYEGRTATGERVVFRGQIGQGETLYANGPLQVQIENTEVYYHSPFGTHGTEAGGGAGCSPSTVGDRVPAQFRVFAAEGTQDTDGDKDVDVLTGTAWIYRLDGAGAQVPCRARGSYARGTKENPSFGDPAAVAEWTLDEDCVVVGNEAGTPGTGTAPRGTFHTHHGVHEPCFGDATAGDCPRNIRHEYAQFLPKPGPFLTLTGPSSAVIGCERPVTVTARLTVDGLAQPDVAVTFSVTGPAPTVPPGGAGVTGADGRAGFTFTAADAGDYTVTAKATYDGQERVATHTVRFDQLPPLSVTLSGPERGQTEEATMVRATVRDACGPLPGATVNFSVAWPDQDRPWTGQATPSSGSATTDAVGQAPFSFSGDRAGDYTVTASTSLATERASVTHTAHLAINTLKRVAANALAEGETSPGSSVIDPAGRYAYFATGPRPSSLDKVVKFDLATFERVGTLTSSSGFVSLLMDPGGRYLYAWGDGTLQKLDLTTFQWAGSLVVPTPPDRSFITSRAGVIDPAGEYAYFVTDGYYTSWGNPENWYPAQVLKIDLATLAVVGTINMLETEAFATAAVMDPGGTAAYFNFRSEDPFPSARVVKIDLGTFQRAGALSLSGSEEAEVGSGVIDPAGNFAYFGTTSASPGRIVKVNLRTLTRVGAITLNVDRTTLGPYPVNRSERDLHAALMDPDGDVAYFATKGLIKPNEHPAHVHVPARLIRINLDTFTRAESMELPTATENEVYTAVIDPDGNYAYLGASQADVPQNYGDPPRPGLVAKVRLHRPPNPALAADADAYATDYQTPLAVPAPGVLEGDADTADGDPLVAGQASDPAGGSVVLNPDGSFTYTPDARFAGTDTFTYTATDGMDHSEPATVSVAVAPPPYPRASSYNYYTNVSLFGGPYTLRGHGQDAGAPASAASPSATCGPGGGATTVTDADGAKAQYGPAVIFGGIWPASHSQAPPSGPLTSGVDCLSGDAGYATASSAVTLMPPGSAYPGGVGPGPFIADEAHSTCTARADGTHTASTTIVGGILETSYDPDTQEAVTTEAVPADPPPNYTRTGTIDHVGDSYRIVFNEQIAHPDGSRTVNAVHMYLLGPTAVGDMVVGSSTCGPVPASAVRARVADFDGDADTDIAVFRPSTGAWFVQGRPTTYHGRDGDAAVPADYDGDGDADIAVFRPATGAWFVQGSPTVYHGRSGDVPVPADYDGDGDADIAVFRPASGGWYVAGRPAVFFGRDGDIPVPGHYDADPEVDLAVFRPSSGGWFVQGQATTYHGRNGDVPVPADYDGDGDTDLAVFRPATGGWYVAGQAAVFFGRNGDVPVPGQYAGGAAAEIAVFRPANGGWYRPGQPTVFFGRSGDAPLPLPHAIGQAFSS